MKHQQPKSAASVKKLEIVANRARWIWLSFGALLLAVIGNGIALAVPDFYASLTPVFLPQALAQDVANLAVTAPAWIVLGILSLRGSNRAFLLWLGVMVFTIYNYVIYTFSIPFGPLFLVWVAVLGLSIYAFIGGITSIRHEGIQSQYQKRGAVVTTAWALIIAAVLFGLLWLSEDIPALIAGTAPQSTVDMNLPTNPVHILDLAFFLPAAIVTGILLLKKQPLGFTAAPAMILFLILTGIPILITPAVQAARGETAAWSVAVPIGSLTVLLLALLMWLVSTIKPAARKA